MRRIALTLAVLTLVACEPTASEPAADSYDNTSSDTAPSDTAEPGCAALLSSSRDPATWANHPPEVVLLFPPAGATLLPSTAQTPTFLVSGRVLGDFAGGVEVNGEPAQVLGNAFHLRLADPGTPELIIDVVQLAADGAAVATVSRTVPIDSTGATPYPLSVVPTPFFPPVDRATLRDLVARDCTPHVSLYVTADDNEWAGELETLEAHGVEPVSYLTKGTRTAVATREAFLALSDEVLDELGVLWLGAPVPEQKYSDTYFDFSTLKDIDLSQLAPGDSIAGVPVVTLGGISLWPTWSQASEALIEDAAVWTSKQSDQYFQAILELDELRWLLQDPLVTWLEHVYADCPDCEGCPCDTSPCATAGPLCPALFGEGASCDVDVCSVP